MVNYDPLRAKWPTVAGATTDEKLTALNAETVAGPDRDVRTAEVLGYLALQGLTTKIEDWLEENPAKSPARTAGKELLRVISSPHVQSIETSVAAKKTAVAGMVAALVAAEVLTPAQGDGLMALCKTTQPWWQASGYTSPINLNDLVAAGIAP